MSFALSAGVTGLQAHQNMIDIAGNNLANVNTTAFKASRITFSELLSETIKKATAPTGTVGGTNPQQMGSGVGVAGITPNTSQGNIVNTGNPLDLALEGEGYFVISDGQQNVYTRAGAFAVDSSATFVDPATGYRVQRIGSVGESDRFQKVGVSDLHIPYDVPVPAKPTSKVTIGGNLSSDATLDTAQTQMFGSNISFSTNDNTATGATEIDKLDQFSGGSASGGELGAAQSGTITFSGYKPDGTDLVETGSSWVDLTMAVGPSTTLQNVLDYLNTNDGIPVRDEVQTLIPNVVATAGTFKLTYGGEETVAINYDADVNTGATGAVNIQKALEDLPGVTVGDITVTGTNLDAGVGGVVFTFDDALSDAGDITFDFDTALTGPTDALSTLTETTKGRDAVRGVLGGNATASLLNGQLRITDTVSGYSQSDLTMAWSGDGTLVVPAYFELLTVGGTEVKGVNIMAYDSQGGQHLLSGAFVRTDSTNTWDMVLTSVGGDISQITMPNRSIKNITFDATTGYYTGVTGGSSNPSEFVVTFDRDPSNPQTISIDFGVVGELNGLTQFAGSSTAVAKEQDGYEMGELSAVSVNNQGIVIGAFSNGIKKDVGTIQIAMFDNPSGLEKIGNGYVTNTANSGIPVATQAMTGGAGSIHGGALEKSNSDVATQFVAMIQAQNGFQANARTIRVANDILRELSNLIR